MLTLELFGNNQNTGRSEVSEFFSIHRGKVTVKEVNWEPNGAGTQHKCWCFDLPWCSWRVFTAQSETVCGQQFSHYHCDIVTSGIYFEN